MTGLTLYDQATPNQVRELPAWLGEVWLAVYNAKAGNDEGQAHRAAWKAVRRAATAKRKNEMINMNDLLDKLLGRATTKETAEPAGAEPDPDLSVLPPDVAETILRRQEVSRLASEKAVNLMTLSNFASQEFRQLYPQMWVVEMYDDAVVVTDGSGDASPYTRYYRVPIESIEVADVADEQVVTGVRFGPRDAWRRVVPVYAGLTVFKEASGSVRWVTVSSGGFEDRDGEVVSTDFLRSAVELADRTKERGPLRIFHIPGADVGSCDFQAVIGEPGLLLESGTFDDTPAGRQAATYYAEHAKEYGCSIKFLYVNRSDDGVYLPPGAIVERSLLPKGKAAFPWSALSLSEVSKMAKLDEIKRAELQRVLGEELAAVIEASLEENAKALAGSGIRFKEVVEADAADAAAEQQEAPDESVNPDAPEVDEGEKALAGQALVGEALEVVLEPEALAGVAEQAKASVLAQLPEIVTEQVRPVADSLIVLQAAVEKLAGAVADLRRSDEAKVAEKVANLPRATVRLAQGMHRPTAVAKEDASANPDAGQSVDFLSLLKQTVHSDEGR